MVNELFQPIRLQDYEEMVEFDSEDESSPKRAQLLKEREQERLFQEKVDALRMKKLIQAELEAKKKMVSKARMIKNMMAQNFRKV